MIKGDNQPADKFRSAGFLDIGRFLQVNRKLRILRIRNLIQAIGHLIQYRFGK